jgi:septal ring-binding cell division protein DamX
MLGKTVSDKQSVGIAVNSSIVMPEAAPASAIVATLPPPALHAERPAVKKLPPPPSSSTLFAQRQSATRDMLAQIGKGGMSIQLYYTDDVSPARIERFLTRAKAAGTLSEIYIIPIKINNKDGFRVLYGAYANEEAARTAMKNLPQRYKDTFALSLHELDGY